MKEDKNFELKGFGEFSKSLMINEGIEDFEYTFDPSSSKEAVKNTDEDPGDLYLVAETEEDKAKAEDLLGRLKSVDPGMGESELKEGESALADWNDLWEHRKSLDVGPLTKVGEWYKGKGAWRINSNKADYLGMTPKWMTWIDPLKMEILENFFPEIFDQKKEEPAQDDLDKIDLKDLGMEDEFDVIPDREMAMANEGLRYIKSFHLNEQGEFTLGPPPGKTAEEASVVTPVMLKRRLIRNYKSRIRSNVLIMGAPGIGKTQLVSSVAKDIAAELGKPIPVVIVTLAQMEPTDLNGIPLIFSKEGEQDFVLKMDKKGSVMMDFAIPGWLPGEGDEDEGILFFDEINNAPQYVLSASLNLLLDRKTRNYKMPIGWRIWAAGNRSMDADVTPLEGRVASRFLGGIVHLVPTIEDWKEWARSESGYFKAEDGEVVEEWYIPNEFFVFLDQSEGTGPKDDADVSEFYDQRTGKPIKTKFKYFYNFDKSALTATGEGVLVGQPQPRTWAYSWAQIFDQVLPDFADQVPDDVDPRMKTVSAFNYALNDKDAYFDMKEILDDIVGKNAATAFFNFIGIFTKYSDADGSLEDKVDNIFKGSRPRILAEGRPVKDVSERAAIIGLIENKMGQLANQGRLTSDQLANWSRYIVELADKRIINEGEISAHLSGIANSSNKKLAEALQGFLQKIAKVVVLKQRPTDSGLSQDQFEAGRDLYTNYKDLIANFLKSVD